MVEFAAVAAVLLILLLGFFEFGRALYHHNMLNENILVGARYLARVSGAVSQGANSCSVSNPAWNNAKISADNLVQYGDVSAVGNTILPNMAVTIPNTPRYESVVDGGTTVLDACVVRVEVAADYEPVISAIPILPFSGWSGDVPLSFRISAAAEERFIGD